MPVSMNLMGMQAESMIAAAMNKGKNFDRAATAFFKTANESGLQGNALVALNSTVRDLSGTNNLIVRKIKAGKIASTLIDAVENSAKKGTELRKQVNQFLHSLAEKYPNTIKVRAALTKDGAVRANEVHMSTPIEKIVAGYENMLRGDLL